MNHLIILSVIVLAAIIHATFQLSVSTLTLMSGHALGRRASKKQVTGLVGGFLLGVLLMTTLLLLAISYITQAFLLQNGAVPAAIWATNSGLLVGLGVAAWLFYYRREKNSTSLWLPQALSRYLNQRSKKTRSGAEAFGLGLTSVLAEGIFIIGPILTASLVLGSQVPIVASPGLILLYTLISILPLTIIAIAVLRGARLSRIQKWREQNKNFLQFIAGAGLIVLGFYLYVHEVIMVAIEGGIY